MIEQAPADYLKAFADLQRFIGFFVFNRIPLDLRLDRKSVG